MTSMPPMLTAIVGSPVMMYEINMVSIVPVVRQEMDLSRLLLALSFIVCLFCNLVFQI